MPNTTQRFRGPAKPTMLLPSGFSLCRQRGEIHWPGPHGCGGPCLGQEPQLHETDWLYPSPSAGPHGDLGQETNTGHLPPPPAPLGWGAGVILSVSLGPCGSSASLHPSVHPSVRLSLSLCHAVSFPLCRVFLLRGMWSVKVVILAQY